MPGQPVTEEILAQVRAHAEEAYPEECCGLVFDAGTLRCVNALSGTEAARSAFRPSDADQLLLARSLDSDRPARALYHSHVDTPPARGAYLSARDVSGASWGGRVLHPGLLHLVVSVRRGRAAEAALFRLEDGGIARVVAAFPAPQRRDSSAWPIIE